MSRVGNERSSYGRTVPYNNIVDIVYNTSGKTSLLSLEEEMEPLISLWVHHIITYYTPQQKISTCCEFMSGTLWYTSKYNIIFIC